MTVEKLFYYFLGLLDEQIRLRVIQQGSGNMLSRKERVKLVRSPLEKEWHNKWWSFMMEHESKLDWYGISSNSFTRDKQEYQLQQYRRHLASYRIQQNWHRIRSDPYHPVGQRKLELDYNREFEFS